MYLHTCTCTHAHTRIGIYTYTYIYTHALTPWTGGRRSSLLVFSMTNRSAKWKYSLRLPPLSTHWSIVPPVSYKPRKQAARPYDPSTWKIKKKKTKGYNILVHNMHTHAYLHQHMHPCINTWTPNTHTINVDAELYFLGKQNQGKTKGLRLHTCINTLTYIYIHQHIHAY
jgi:hypothetical protein